MMNPEERRALEDRRAALRADHELRERHALVDHLVAELRRRGASPQVVAESPALDRWLGRFFDPDGHDRRIDRNHLTRFEEIPEVSEGAAAEWLTRCVAGINPPTGDAAVHFLWSNAVRPAIRLSVRNFLQFPGSLSDDFEAWAVCPEQGWLVEYIRDEGWMWGATDPAVVAVEVSQGWGGAMPGRRQADTSGRKPQAP